MRIHKLIIFIYILSTISCRDNIEINQNIANTKTISFIDNDFKQVYKAKSIKLEGVSDSLFNIGKIACTEDYLVIIDFANVNPLHIINRKDDSYLGAFGDIGQGPGEVLVPWGLYSIYKNSIEVFDSQQQKIIDFNIDSLMLGGRYLKEYDLKKFENNSNSALIFKNKIYSTSGTNIEYRLFEIGFSEIENNLNGYGNIPDKVNDIPDHIHANANITNMQMDNNVFAFNYLNTPLIQVLNLNSKIDFFLSGPEFFTPIYKVDNKLKSPMYMFTKESRLGYTDAKVTNKHIYALYNGNKVSDPTGQNARIIYVFELDGSLVKKIVLDKGVINFDIYNDKIIYGIRIVEGRKFEVLKFHI